MNDEEWTAFSWPIIERWWQAAIAWLDENPDRLVELDAWEARYVTGNGAHGTHDWPGWADSPMGAYPRLKRPGWRVRGSQTPGCDR